MPNLPDFVLVVLGLDGHGREFNEGYGLLKIKTDLHDN